MFRRLFRGNEPPKPQEAEVKTPPVEEVAPPPVQPPVPVAVAPAIPEPVLVPAVVPVVTAPVVVNPPPTEGAPSEITYSSVAEYDAAMRAAQPEPPRRIGGLRRLFGGEERPVEEIQREERKTQQAVQKTRAGLFGRISEMFQSEEPITPVLWEELEELMIMADVGVDTTLSVIEKVRKRVERDNVRSVRDARAILKKELVRLLDVDTPSYSERSTKPYVILVVGVNGAGKTTLIAKMSKRYKIELGKNVLLAAADTFRAAAVEQLTTWADRVGVAVISQGQGADPGAVAYDAVESTYARNTDILIIDTAGRLQSKYNLMQELQKIRNIVRKKVEWAPHEVLLVIDATTGQNGLSQARAFAEAAEVTHLAITKLDGTSKGGIAFAMVQEIERPIKYIGTGEKLDDIAIFDPNAFVDALFDEHS